MKDTVTLLAVLQILPLITSNAEAAQVILDAGSPPCAEMRTTLKPGEERRLTVDIAGWADGDYRTDIQCSREGQQLDEPLVRWLRKQTIPAPRPAEEPIDVRNLTTLFVDNEYISTQTGLRRAVNPAEPFAVTTARMGRDRPEQKPVGGIRLEADGTWVVRFTDTEREDRNGTTTRHYTARSRDTRKWTVAEDKAASAKPKSPRIKRISQAAVSPSKPAFVLNFAAGSEAKPLAFRHYAPETDGPVNIRQVRLRHTGIAKDVRWGASPCPSARFFPCGRNRRANTSSSPGSRCWLTNTIIRTERRATGRTRTIIS